MSYRRTKRYQSRRARGARMHAAKAAKRMAGPAPEYPAELPDVRIRITVERFDFGHEVQVMELRKTGRVDCFDAYANGSLWKRRIGLSRVLAYLRKANPRCASPRAN